MERLLQTQKHLIEAMEQELRNFKKDGADRKTPEHIKRRVETLDACWLEFQENHKKLVQGLDPNNDYFVGEHYESTKKFYMETREFYAQSTRSRPATPPQLFTSNSNPSTNNKDTKEPRQTSTGNYSKLDEMLKKQKSNFKAFDRTLSQIQLENIKDKWEFEDTLKTLQSRWQVIDKLHWEIDSELDTSDSNYEELFTQQEANYLSMKRAINSKLWSVAHREKSTPQLDIPVFTGNYQQWVSFKDLFCEAIHNNPSLSDAQKMQFLKGKLRGEAERLIQHLQISSENYHTSWEIINHRYNNEKLIFTSYMNTLMNIPVVQHPLSSHVKRIHDVTKECLNAIKNLGVNIDSWDPILIHILSQKLDSETHKEYMNSLQNPRELPKIKDFLEFLENKFTTMESSRRKQDGAQKPSSGQASTSGKQENPAYYKNFYQSSASNKASSSSFKARKNKLNCPVCHSLEHNIYFCNRFLEMSPAQKKQVISNNELCNNCLFKHYGKACTSNKRCRKCNEAHNSLLHDLFSKCSNTTPNANATETNQRQNNTFVARNRDVQGLNPRHVDAPEILLATALIKVQGADGENRTLRALIDQGSQISIISENAAQLLKLKRKNCRGVITGVGTKDTTCKGKLIINCSSLTEKFTFQTEVFIMNKLTRNLPNYTFPQPDWEYLRNIQLADPDFYISRPIDLLLGADVYANILLEGICRADNIRPVAQQTRLGWILCGMTQTFHCNVVLNNMEEIQFFCQTEDLPESTSHTSEESECIKFYKSTTTRMEDGKYQVRLPLKTDINEIGDSKKQAIAQFMQLERKFTRNQKVASEYKLFIKEYQDLGHMKLADRNLTPEYFLPHHCIIKQSTTTALRVVFNASQNTSNGKSLNDCMYTGPNLQKDLFELILRWRQFRIGFTADIEKMFRQIWIHPDDQKLQKILWRPYPNHLLQEYQLTTVTYGTKAAPFLAMMTLRQLAEDERDTFPDAAKVVETSFYMDDLLHGSHTMEEALYLQQGLIELLKRGGFNLRKWTSNDQGLLREKNVQQEDYTFKQATKTLGLRWNPEQDIFIFQSTIQHSTDSGKDTKRKMLSDISKLFDPLGWLTPISTKLKLLFQRIWECNIQWDSKVPDEIETEWNIIKQDLININQIKIPRWISTGAMTEIELHGYCDASLKAYACVIYCKIKTKEGRKVIMLSGKSKLVPRSKNLTLPKLELNGAYLLSKVMHKVMKCLSDYQVKVYGWIDSTAVLGWLQGDPDRWSVYVSNRVRKVTEIMPPDCWGYVKSAENPADCASRGLTTTQLIQHQLWWQGPSWLTTFSVEKQENPIYKTTEEIMEKTQVNLVTHANGQSLIKTILHTYSSITKATRVLAWVRRFISTSRKQDTRKETYLTLPEIRLAKLELIKEEQLAHFPEEILHLKTKNKILTKSKISSLNPFLDEHGVLRVGGRLSNAHISDEMKFPIILPYSSRLTEMIIDHAHKLTYHGGARVTLAFIRQKYWLLSGNRATKKFIRACVTCKKHKPVKQTQIMGDLPSSRVNQTRPFMHTGVDFTGHVYIKANKGRGVKTLKAYVAVFVCMVTKAVHLELVSDLTSSSFIAALRRMAARRGKPSHMYSDNGRNFVGANNILRQEYQEIQQVFNEQFMQEITDMEITWHFNAPSWPSAGGLFEAAVKSFKYHLKRVIGEQKLTFEEFSTLLTQIEVCLNSRPLCALTEDPDDLDFLTPSHFLAGGPVLTIVETEKDMRTRWHLTQKIFQDLWKRWRSEYLTQLASRCKWRQAQKNVSIGDVVLVHDDNLPPGKWLMGRVVDLHPGQDGHVRVVTLKTKTGYLKRPVTKISILTEYQEDRQQSDNNINNQELKRNRRHKPNKVNIASVMSACLLFMTLITSSDCMVNVTKFRDSQGMFFDKLADMQLIKDEWKLVVYYEMGPYWQGTKALNQYISALESACLPIKENGQCHVIVLQLRHGYSELEYYNQLLLNQHVTTGAPARRKRRGLINAVGYIANDLFGVLDQNFAEQYKQDISSLRENDRHIIALWKNQTSIVEAQNNLLKRTENIINQQHKVLHQHMISLEKSMNELKNNARENMILNNFAIGAIVASNMLHSLRNLQDNLLNTITDVYHGSINLHLITPQQLSDELSTISSQMPKEVALPIDNVHSDLWKIYSLLKTRARMLEEYLIFEIRLPLVSRELYEILKIIPISKNQEGKSVSLVPVSDYISINMKKDTYIPMTENDVRACLVQAGTYFCHSQKPEYRMQEDKSLCLLENSNCKTEVNLCKNRWLESYSINTYIYFCCEQCNIKTMCKDQMTALKLQASGLISIGHGCIIKTETLTIYPHKPHSSEIRVSPELYSPHISPINDVINITIPYLTEENKTFQNILQDTDNVGHKIADLKTQGDEMLSQISSFNSHDIHHYAMIYVLVSILTLIGLIMTLQRARCRWQVPASVVEVPTTRTVIEMTSPPQVSPRTNSQVFSRERQDRSTSPIPRKTCDLNFD